MILIKGLRMHYFILLQWFLMTVDPQEPVDLKHSINRDLTTYNVYVKYIQFM